MSNGNPPGSSPSVEPHATISAQDVVQGQPERYGFLRKRGQKERMLENLHLSRHINWRQRFVVIKDGCCYCYTDEVARAPLQTFSLQGYNRIYRSRSDRAAFVFTLEPAANCRKKVHTFAATSDDERLVWMQKFREAMTKANDVHATPARSSLSDPDDIYVELEKPVYEPTIAKQLSRGLDDSYEEEECESSDDSDYDRPDEILMEAVKEKSQRRNVPLPPVPTQASANEVSHTARRPAVLPPRPGVPSSPDSSGDGTVSSRPKPPDPRHRPAIPVPSSPQETSPPNSTFPKPKLPAAPGPTSRAAQPLPAPATRPKPPIPVASSAGSARPSPPAKPTNRLSERDSFFDDSDREAAIQILRDSNTPGTFLIRKSRQGDSKVLVVMTTEDVKEYKIFTENGEVSLDKKRYFKSVDELLDAYNRSPLPNRQQTLTRSYSSCSSSSKH